MWHAFALLGSAVAEVTFTSQCKTDPNPVQDWSVKEPAFHKVTPSCTYDGHENVFAQVCDYCDKKHQPCAGEFAACAGCKGNVKGHDKTDKVSCKSIVEFLVAENTCVVALVEVDDVNAAKPDVSKYGTQGKSAAPIPDANVSQVLSQQCSAGVDTHEWNRIPALFEYSCEECGTQGSTGLLKRCCDICLDFHEALGAPDSKYQPFTTCKGCDVEYIESESAVDGKIAFTHRELYKPHTKDAALESMKKFVQGEPLDQDQSKCRAESAENDQPQRRLESNYSLRRDRRLDEADEETADQGYSGADRLCPGHSAANPVRLTWTLLLIFIGTIIRLA